MERAVKDARVHDAWSRHFLFSCKVDRRGAEYNVMHDTICDEIEHLLRCVQYEPSLSKRSVNYKNRDPDVSFLAARFISLLSKDDVNLSQNIWDRYLLVAASDPQIIEWENVNECLKSGTIDSVDLRLGLLTLQDFDNDHATQVEAQLHLSFIRYVHTH